MRRVTTEENSIPGNIIETGNEPFQFLESSKSASDKILDLLDHNVIGTPGVSMLYQHLNVADKIKSIANPYFVTLTKGDSIIGTTSFCKRVTSNCGQPYQSFYIRYFTFRDQYRREVIAEKTPSRRSELRNEIVSLLEGKGLEVNPQEKFFHYAYVDPRNTRSARLCKEFGFEKVRQYSTIIFSRVTPKATQDFEVVETSTLDALGKEHLSEYYKNYNTFTTENSIGRNYYYVKNRDGIIVAGVQVNPEHWSIHSLSGLLNKFLLTLFSHVPLLNRLINRDYKFLTLEAIYVEPGFENVLQKLFESLLVRYNVYSAITVVDRDSQLYNSLKSLDLGLTSKITKEFFGDMICKFVNFTSEEKLQFINNPAYISGIDVT